MSSKLFGLLASGLALLLASCNTYKVTMNDPYGRHNVINPKWTIKTDSPNHENLVQYDCVYIREKQAPPVYPELIYEVWRFWPTGQLMGKDLTSNNLKDLDAQMSTFYYSWGDYYKIDGRNFTIESFNSIYHTFAKGYIDEDGNLIMTHSGVAGSRLTKWKEPQKFVKTKINLAPLEPDW